MSALKEQASLTILGRDMLIFPKFSQGMVEFLKRSLSRKLETEQNKNLIRQESGKEEFIRMFSCPKIRKVVIATGCAKYQTLYYAVDICYFV